MCSARVRCVEAETVWGDVRLGGTDKAKPQPPHDPLAVLSSAQVTRAVEGFSQR